MQCCCISAVSAGSKASGACAWPPAVKHDVVRQARPIHGFFLGVRRRRVTQTSANKLPSNGSFQRAGLTISRLQYERPFSIDGLRKFLFHNNSAKDVAFMLFIAAVTEVKCGDGRGDVDAAVASFAAVLR